MDDLYKMMHRGTIMQREIARPPNQSLFTPQIPLCLNATTLYSTLDHQEHVN